MSTQNTSTAPSREQTEIATRTALDAKNRALWGEITREDEPGAGPVLDGARVSCEEMER